MKKPSLHERAANEAMCESALRFIMRYPQNALHIAQAAIDVIEKSKPTKRKTMKKATALCIAALGIAVAGCNTTQFTATKPDGTKVTIINTRCFWSTDSYAASLTPDKAELMANKSRPDSEALAAMMAAAVTAAKKP